MIKSTYLWVIGLSGRPTSSPEIGSGMSFSMSAKSLAVPVAVSVATAVRVRGIAGPTQLFAAVKVVSRRHSGVPISEPIPRAGMGNGRRWALAPPGRGLPASMRPVARLADLVAAPGKSPWPVLLGHLASAAGALSLNSFYYLI